MPKMIYINMAFLPVHISANLLKTLTPGDKRDLKRIFGWIDWEKEGGLIWGQGIK
jgi:hypothetical protein